MQSPHRCFCVLSWDLVQSFPSHNSGFFLYVASFFLVRIFGVNKAFLTSARRNQDGGQMSPGHQQGQRDGGECGNQVREPQGKEATQGEDSGVTGPRATSSRDLHSGAKTSEVWGLVEEKELGPSHV